MHFRRVLASTALLLACTPKSAETAGDTDTSSAQTDGAEVTSATHGAPTTGAGTTTAGPTTGPSHTAASSAEDTATGPATSTSTDTGTGTDTGDDTAGGGLPGACAAICMRWDMCDPGSAGPVDACIADCLDGVDVPSACAMATAAAWSCIAGLPCAEALKFLTPEGEPPTSCLREQQAADDACFDPGCGGEVSGGDDFCELEQDCGDKVQNFHCDIQANVCTCTEDGVPGNQCPADGFCDLAPDEQRAAITACCMWVWL